MMMWLFFVQLMYIFGDQKIKTHFASLEKLGDFFLDSTTVNLLTNIQQSNDPHIDYINFLSWKRPWRSETSL